MKSTFREEVSRLPAGIAGCGVFFFFSFLDNPHLGPIGPGQGKAREKEEQRHFYTSLQVSDFTTTYLFCLAGGWLHNNISILPVRWLALL